MSQLVLRGGAAVVLGAVLACHSAAPASEFSPRPERLATNTSPRAALRAAAEQLFRNGFFITSMDSTATDAAIALRAEREGRPGESLPGVSCESARDPRRRPSVVPALMLLVTARPLADGRADVVVASRVRTSYLRLTADPPQPPNETDCRSTGETERQLIEALGGGAP